MFYLYRLPIVKGHIGTPLLMYDTMNHSIEALHKLVTITIQHMYNDTSSNISLQMVELLIVSV